MKDKHRRDEVPRLLGVILVLILCILGASAGAYARYSATYHADQNITLKIEPGTYALVLHYGTVDAGTGAEETGESETYELICKVDEPVTVPKVSEYFTRRGYTGIGWNKSADGSDTEYAEGYTAKNLSDGGTILHLYARWTINSYSVTYDANGGRDAPETETVDHGTVHTLSITYPTREHYIFMGWFSQKDSGERLETIKVEDDITVFARWRLDTVCVTYMPNFLPQGYTQVEWIRGDGESYIDTGIQLSEDSQIRLIYEIVESSTDGDGDSAPQSRDDTGDVSLSDAADGSAGTVESGSTGASEDTGADAENAGIMGVGGSSGFSVSVEAGQLSLNYGESSESLSVSAMYTESPCLLVDGSAAVGKHELYANRHVWRIDGEEAATFAYRPFETENTALIFGAAGVSGYFTGRIYGAQFMDRSGPAATFIPAVSGAGEPGLYDIEKGCFTAKSGSGELVVGPEAGKKVEVIRDTAAQAIEDPFERGGYRLLQWNTEPDGSGDVFLPEADIPSDKDLILYGIWQKEIPVLKAGHLWYDASMGGDESAYSEIRIVDEITAQIADSADAVWNGDAENQGTIRCYKTGTVLWIAGNGSGSIRMPTDPGGMFRGFSAAAGIEGLDLLDSAKCETLEWMFCRSSSGMETLISASGTSSAPDVSDCADGAMTALTDLRGIEAWDVSKVKSMEGMFCGLSGITEISDLSQWDTSGVTSMKLAWAGCANLESMDLNSWDTAAVTTLYGAFYGCRSLRNLKAGRWDTSGMKNLAYAFCGMGQDAESFALDLTGWNVTDAVDMASMFRECKKLKTIYVSDIWEVSSETSDAGMFLACGELVGQAGTAYSASHVGRTYAHIDTLENPGYLTRSVAKALVAGSTLALTYSSAEYAVGDVYDGAEITAVHDIPESAQAAADVGWYAQRNSIRKVEVEKNFHLFKPTGMAYWFNGMTYVTTFEGMEHIDTSRVTSLNCTFASAGRMAASFIMDLSGWDVSKVTTFARMFNEAGFKADQWDVGDLSRWDVSSAENLARMFYNAGSYSRTWNIGDIRDWDVSHVTDFSYFLSYVCRGASSWTVDLSGWDTSAATSMRSMFEYSAIQASLWSVGDLSQWNTSQVTDMSYMFGNAGKACDRWYIGDVSNWDTSKTKRMNKMFFCAGTRAGAFELDVSGWDTSLLTNTSMMFQDTATYARQCVLKGLSNWNVSNVNDMEYMFRGTGASTPGFTLDLGGWNTANVTRTNGMFWRMYTLETIYVGSGWNMSKVSSSAYMFTDCTSLKGANGTVYSSEHTDAEYARVDTADTPGYLTAAPTVSSASAVAADNMIAAAAMLQETETTAGTAATTDTQTLTDMDIESAGTGTSVSGGSGDLQLKYMETLLIYEDSLYAGGSGTFIPGISPVTGEYYASKEEWLSSEEYESWAEDCRYLKSLLESS